MPYMYTRDKKYIFCHFVYERINTTLKHFKLDMKLHAKFGIVIYDFVPVIPV